MKSIVTAQVWVLAALCPAILSAQSPRDEWRLFGGASEVKLYGERSLADADLASGERDVIYRELEAEVRRSGIGNSPEEEKREILTARVGSVYFSDDRSEQILVRGPQVTCGYMGGNCSIRVFIKRNGGLNVALVAEGNSIVAATALHKGFHDLAVRWHMGAADSSVTVYRWNGTSYQTSDCYLVKGDLSRPDKPPAIRDCPPTNPDSSHPAHYLQ